MRSIDFTPTARRLGMSAAAGVVLLGIGYVVTLASGLLSLRSPQQPIGDPFFPILEILTILSAPLMVALMVSVHAWAPPDAKAYSLTALVFMSLLAGVTCAVHFVILTVGRQIDAAGHPWLPLFFSFAWPSVPYALDILAWDLFFGLSMLFAAPVFSGDRHVASIRVVMIVSGVLALAGISGAVIGDMQLRMIGAFGYAGLFPVVALLLALLFARSRAVEPRIAADFYQVSRGRTDD
jgi:hypothetical protein